MSALKENWKLLKTKKGERDLTLSVTLNFPEVVLFSQVYLILFLYLISSTSIFQHSHNPVNSFVAAVCADHELLAVFETKLKASESP